MKKYKKVIYSGAAVTLAVAALFFAWYETGGVVLREPEVTLPAPASEENPERVPVTEEPQNSGGVTPETVQAVISTLARASSYIRELEFFIFWEEGFSASELTVYARGSEFHIIDKSPSGLTNILIHGEDIWKWHEDRGEYYSGKIHDKAFEAADKYMRMVTYEHLLDLPKEAISQADFVSFNGEPCVYVEYLSSRDLGYVSRIYISVENGLVMSEETYEGDKLVYKLTAVLTEITTPSDEIMAPPP